MSKTIVFTTPVFFLLIAQEWVWGRRASAHVPGSRTYRLNGGINSTSLGPLSQVASVLTKVLTVGIYAAVFQAAT